MRITKKAKRELCQKIMKLSYKKENKVLNLYELLKLDYEILLNKFNLLKNEIKN